jgi:hypothetical protein
VSSWAYNRRIGGLLRCCLHSLDEQMAGRRDAGEGPPKDGDTLRTSCCNTPLIHRGGAWEWEGGK